MEAKGNRGGACLHIILGPSGLPRQRRAFDSCVFAAPTAADFYRDPSGSVRLGALMSGVASKAAITLKGSVDIVTEFFGAQQQLQPLAHRTPRSALRDTCSSPRVLTRRAGWDRL